MLITIADPSDHQHAPAYQLLPHRLLVGGIVACFFGYRLFRIVLAIFGFILGALAASSIFGMSDTGPMIVAAVVGGLIGAGDSHRRVFRRRGADRRRPRRRRRPNRVRGGRSRSALSRRRLPGDRRRGGRDVPAALLHHRRHRLRRRVDDDRRRDGAGGRSDGAGGGGGAATCGWPIR